MDIVWSKIKGFDNYSVSNSGLIRNDNRGTIKAQQTDKYGYKTASIYKDGKGHPQRVHRLVADAFLSNPDKKPQINHKDGDKTNNNVNNLEWVTCSENIGHAINKGLRHYVPSYGMKGKKNPNAGAKGKPVLVKETGEVFSSIIACSKALNIRNRGICDVLKGRQKSHHGYHFEYI